MFYLNAWEFMSLWEVKILLEPVASTSVRKSAAMEADSEESKAPPLTSWTNEAALEWSVNPAAEKYFRDNGGDILFYPVRKWGHTDLRQIFYMERRRRPMVPAPQSCPMPDKQVDSERRDRLYLIYLKPWVLDRKWAIAEKVPHLRHLNNVKVQGTLRTSYS